MSRHQRIAAINDCFRAKLGLEGCRNEVPGRYCATRGIAALAPEIQLEVWNEVRKFDRFTEDNDPYGEHDFGVIQHSQAGKIFWKIDYYDASFETGSEDPTDLQKTHRVLTLMLAEEW